MDFTQQASMLLWGCCEINYVHCTKCYKLFNSSHKSWHGYLEFYRLQIQHPCVWCHAGSTFHLDRHIHEGKSAANYLTPRRFLRRPLRDSHGPKSFRVPPGPQVGTCREARPGTLALLRAHCSGLSKGKDFTSKLICLFSYQRASAFRTWFRACLCSKSASVCNVGCRAARMPGGSGTSRPSCGGRRAGDAQRFPSRSPGPERCPSGQRMVMAMACAVPGDPGSTHPY